MILPEMKKATSRRDRSLFVLTKSRFASPRRDQRKFARGKNLGKPLATLKTTR